MLVGATIGDVHPIERLRYVARADGASPAVIVSESARALSTFHADPAGLVMATRRLVAHHPTLGAMWWMGARVLTATDPGTEAFTLSEELEDDDTPRQLARALDPEATVLIIGWPAQAVEALAKRGSGTVFIADVGREAAGSQRYLDNRGVDAVLVPLTGLAAAVRSSDVVVIECLAGGPDEGLFDAASAIAAAAASAFGVEVWAVVGVGRMLPGRMWEALVSRWDALDDAWELPEDLVPWSLVGQVVGPDGVLDAAAVATLTTAPVAPELLRP